MMVQRDFNRREWICIHHWISWWRRQDDSGTTVGVNGTRTSTFLIVDLTGFNSSHIQVLRSASGNSAIQSRGMGISVNIPGDFWWVGRGAPGSIGTQILGESLGGGGSESGYIARIGMDEDGDGIESRRDNCPVNYNPIQENYDNDLTGDICDSDDDGDGINDNLDSCKLNSAIGWISNSTTDYDSDGCHDLIEDYDDDNDLILDSSDFVLKD